MQPDIYLGSLRISEPVIALTGLGICLVCGYAWQRLRHCTGPAPAQRWMIRFFGLMAISSIIGPFFGHAFYYVVGFPGKYACWVFSMLSLGAFAQAAIEHARPLLPQAAGRTLTGLNIAALVFGLVFSAAIQRFDGVVVHSAIALLGIMMPLEAFVYSKRRDPGSHLLLWSLPLAILSLVPMIVKWSPGIWFSYLDVGHVILYGCFGLMLLGAERMQVHTPQTQAQLP